MKVLIFLLINVHIYLMMFSQVQKLNIPKPGFIMKFSTLRLVHAYNASISTRKSMCEPGQGKHNHKKKKCFPSSYACACACIAPVHTYFFLYLFLCLLHTCESALTSIVDTEAVVDNDCGVFHFSHKIEHSSNTMTLTFFVHQRLGFGL